jgi:hypothetical protein
MIPVNRVVVYNCNADCTHSRVESLLQEGFVIIEEIKMRISEDRYQSKIVLEQKQPQHFLRIVPGNSKHQGVAPILHLE